MAIDNAEIEAVYRTMAARRDRCHFLLADPVKPDMLAQLLRVAHMAPSVGFMQPWRFVPVSDRRLREIIYGIVERERIETAHAIDQREGEFMRLKVEGVHECGKLLVAALMERREEHIFGRRTLPEMDLAPVACSVQEHVAGGARRRPGHGLGVAVRSAGARHASWCQAGGDPVPGPRVGLLSEADAGAGTVGAAPVAARSVYENGWSRRVPIKNEADQT